MRKWWLFVCIGFVLGLLLGLFFLQIFHVSLSLGETYGVLEFVYYLVSPIGVIATVVAVIVALFGDDFRRILHKEKCQVTLEEDHFVEDIDGQESASHIESKRYDCRVIIKNIGGREIEDCSVSMISCKYRGDQQSKWKDLKIKNKIQLFWNTPGKHKDTILAGESKSLLLLRINPDGDQSTPDDNSTSLSTRCLSIIGFHPDLRYRQRGYWEIEYSICTPHNELSKFKVSVSWTGEWKQRETEMVEETSVTLVTV